MAAAQAASMVDVHARFIRSLEQAGRARPRARVRCRRRGARRAQGGGPRADRARARGRCSRTPRSRSTQELLASDLPDDPYLVRRARALLPDAVCASASPRRCARTRCGARSSPRGSSTTWSTGAGRRSRSGSREETGAARRRHRARLRGRPRGVRDARRCGPRSRRSTARSPPRRRPRCCSRAADPVERATRWLLRNRPPAARHRRDGRALRPGAARRCGGAAGAARTVCARGSEGAREGRGFTDDGVPAELAARVARAAGARPGARHRRGRGRRPGSTSSRSPRPTSGSASGSSCTGCATGSSPCRATTAGRRWPARRCATTSTPSRRVSPPTSCARARTASRRGSSSRAGWAENAAAIERSLQVLADISTGGTLDLARLSVAVREIRNLIQSTGAGGMTEEVAAAPPPAPLS